MQWCLILVSHVAKASKGFSCISARQSPHLLCEQLPGIPGQFSGGEWSGGDSWNAVRMAPEQLSIRSNIGSMCETLQQKLVLRRIRLDKCG